MSFLEIVLVSISVSLDAFIVSVFKGKEKNSSIKCAIWFGLFQFLMPFLGFNLGKKLEYIFDNYCYLISIIVLLYLGINSMIKRSTISDGKNMFLLAVSTSMDAFSIGVAYMYGYGINNSYITFVSMGVITACVCYLGSYIGKQMLKEIKNINIIGGVILILLAIKLFITHFF